MTNEERDIITRFIQRVGGAPQAAGFGAGSVPATTPQPQLPPIDPEADRLLSDLFTRYPEARYRITQMAFAQEAALAEAHNRIQHMQWEMQQVQQQAQAQQQGGPSQGQSPWGQQAQPQQQSRGFFGGLFGGGQPHAAPGPQYTPQYAPPPSGQYAPPPQPQYPPGYQPGMFRSGSGFLGSALTTAAGVAGGMVVGNALMDLFSGGRGGFGGGFGGPGYAGTPSETITNNYYGDAGQGALPQDNPWAGAGQDAGGADPANAPNAGSDPFGGGGADPGQWDQTADPDPGTDQGGWDDAGSGGGSDDDLV